MNHKEVMPHRTHVSVMNIGKSMFRISRSPGYVRSWKETIEFPCNYPTAVKYYDGALLNQFTGSILMQMAMIVLEELQQVPS